MEVFKGRGQSTKGHAFVVGCSRSGWWLDLVGLKDFPDTVTDLWAVRCCQTGTFGAACHPSCQRGCQMWGVSHWETFLWCPDKICSWREPGTPGVCSLLKSAMPLLGTALSNSRD